MNELFELLGLQSWKPIVTALLLPPVPLLLGVLVGARMMFWRRGLGWLLLLLCCAGLWLGASSHMGTWLERVLLAPPAPLSPERIAELRREAGGKLAVVVLGGGREALAPEYGVSNLSAASHARLHYGLWLARQLNAPVMFSGGVGHGESQGAAEAETAQRMAERDYGRPLKWVEAESRDTRENAVRSITMLRQAGITEVVLVTHGWHMNRALRAFELEVPRAEWQGRLVAAPMGLAAPSERGALGWLPSNAGFMRVRVVLREQLGLWFGA